MNKGVFSRLLRELGAAKIPLVISFITSAASVVVALYIPVLIGEFIDMIADGKFDAAKASSFLICVGLLAASSALFRWISDSLSNSVVFKTVASMRKAAYSKLSRLPVSYFDTHPKGETINRIINDTDAVGSGLLLGLSQFFGGIVTIVFTLIFMLRIDLKITALVVVLTPLSLVVSSVIAKKTYRLFTDQSKKRAEETSFLTETLGNLKLIKSFVREDETARKYDEVCEATAKSSRRAIFSSSLVNPSTRVVCATIYAAVGLAGAFSVIGGGLSVGALTVFLNYAGQYSKPFNEISAVIAEIQGSAAAAARVYELIDEADEEDGEATLKSVRGDVSFSHVSFSYDKEKTLLTDVTFDVKAGGKVAVVGPTGGGKTTLINLLMRFYDPDGGVITVDGVDTRTLSKDSLRSHFGMVLQDTFLFDATVMENLTVGAEVSAEEVEEACRLTRADNFIKKLPQGYGTPLTEGGGELSEGERQLLSITRVMLTRPAILILDEATSSVDTRTEAEINAALDRLMAGKTSFIVAHRISTVKNADMILVMRDGDIVEIGRHDELMAAGGFYSELYRSQFEA